jgi:putative colanic acid biosynthesis acetyltransferase WcaF
MSVCLMDDCSRAISLPTCSDQRANLPRGHHPEHCGRNQRTMTNRHELTARKIGAMNRVARALWQVVWLLLFRPSPTSFHVWRRVLLRCFGASIGRGAHPYPSARIWAPWNLVMGDDSCLAHYVDCYSVDLVHLGPRVTVSQYSYLCTASHDYTKRAMPLVTGPIRIKADAWVTAGVFVGPGVTIGEGAVVGARSTVTRDVAPWAIVAGSPPRTVGIRPNLAPLEQRDR